MVMKKYWIAASSILLIGAANAADLGRPVYKAPPAPVAAPYSWTGCYIGAEGGGGWGHARWKALTAADPADVGLTLTEMNLSGGLAGGTIGCNYQFAGSWVVGIENDISWTNIKGDAFDIPPFNTNVLNTVEQKWLDTLRGRIGYAWDRVYLYATGGAAFGRVTATAFDTGGSNASVSEDHTHIGWTAGAGVEWAFYDRWSVKVEYLHVDLGSKDYFVPPQVVNGFTFQSREISVHDDIVRAGVNYKFF
jgi:outer membrane immunogenic protein